MTNEQIEKLIAMGGKRWTNYGKDRIYMDGCKLIGIDRASNIQTRVNYRGETVTERLSNGICNSIANAKIYVEVADGKICIEPDRYARGGVAFKDDICEAIENIIG